MTNDIINDQFNSYCYGNIADTRQFRNPAEPVRYASDGVGVLSSFVLATFVVAGNGCSKVVHRFFLFYGVLGTLLSASQLTAALSCRPGTQGRTIYNVSIGTSCYFRFALYLLICWIATYSIAAGTCRKNVFKSRAAKTVAVATVMGIPLTCAWGPAYTALLKCSADDCNNRTITYYSIATAFVSIQSLSHVTTVVLAVVIAAKLVHRVCSERRGEHLRYYKRALVKLAVVVAAMAVALFIYIVDLIVTVAYLVSGREKGSFVSQHFYLEALPLLGIALIPLLYLCFVCDKNGFTKNHDSIRLEFSPTSSAEDQAARRPRVPAEPA